MILVIAKVNVNVEDAKKISLNETLYDNLIKGVNARGDLQIIEVMVCSSDKQYGTNVDVEVFMSVDQILDQTGDKSFFYEGVVKGSVRSEGFVVTNIETLNVDEYVCKTFYKANPGSVYRG